MQKLKAISLNDNQRFIMRSFSIIVIGFVRGQLLHRGFNHLHSVVSVRGLFLIFKPVRRKHISGHWKNKGQFLGHYCGGNFRSCHRALYCSQIPSFIGMDLIYTGGWGASALSMIWFFCLERFPINWWKAYGEPLIPTLVMGLMEAGRFTGPMFPLFVIIGIICLLLLTLYMETKAFNAKAVRLFRQK